MTKFNYLMQFAECIQIGRDLLRLLQAVAKIPEFTDLWRDLMLHPYTEDWSSVCGCDPNPLQVHVKAFHSRKDSS